MTNQEIRQLAVWLKENHLAGAELRRPGMHLVLKRSSDAVAVVVPQPVKAADKPLLKTPGLGRLLLTHPDQTEALVAVGSQVAQGQLVAFLQIGDLLLPVRSQQAGRVAAVLTPCGTTVGYGEAFMRLDAA
ncbi:biotin/lipoyl-containing protein [Pseudomonas fildesensis]|jgi:acetyl-CoA carboxylase biotin carboxyl carrier protein|uniref:Acetyl-COA carboxylase n=1 Tax=Pseudomonas fildesensis TaxID=1674920 RepID=A0A0J8FQ29_9PSED|nr:biotin/lipoyl-containing protein [Pseudomonas fildesensis]KMT52335.1 acetyl-COA carboxylase [Pseudomonas fildesensis]